MCTDATQIAALREAIIGIDKQVPLLDGSTRQYVFLDNAASTPTLRGVQQKVDEFLGWYSSVHRGAGFKSIISTEAYEQARDITAHFVGADPATHSVIFGKNTTEAINKLANRLDFRPGDVVITTVMEHHSNDLPWRPKAQVVHVGIQEDGSLDVDDLHQKLEQFAGRVKLVAVTGASNVSGFAPPIHDIAETVHHHRARLLVDCAQLAPHRAVNMGPLGEPRSLDFVTISAHKMYAPFGTGALIGPKDFFAQGDPDYRGGGTVDIVTLDQVYWTAPPERDEAGSPNVVGAVALAASMRLLSEVGMEAIAGHEKKLTRHALQRLNAIDGVRIYGSTDPERLDDRLGVISFAVKDMPHARVAAILSFEGGIGVRNGCFCAHPYLLRLLDVGEETAQTYQQEILQGDRSNLPGLVRASFGCYNTAAEIDHLAAMLERIAAGDYRGDYVLHKASGDYVPRTFDPGILHRYFTL
ncbi:MAG: aminotransferase class V-fold PLP-dependent enzyme [Chloroflexota bacterium]